MSALTVNLKQMVQRQPAGLACGALGVMVVLIFMLTGDPGWDNTVLMISLFSWAVGMAIGIMQKDVLNKPFALVLPGHHEMVRRMSFLVGAGFAVVCLFVVAVLHGFKGDFTLTGTFAAAFVWMSCYWFGAAMILMPWLFYVYLLLMLFGLFRTMELLVMSAVSDYAFLTIVLCIGLNAAIWILLGKEQLLRWYCQNKWLGTQNSFNPVRRGWGEMGIGFLYRARPGWLERKVTAFCLRRMAACAPLGTKRFLWGQLGVSLGPVLSGKKSLLGFGFMLVYLLLFGTLDMGGGGFALMACFIWMPFTTRAALPAYSSLLVPGGRRERFAATLTTTAVLAVLVTVILVCFAVLTIPLEKILPGLPIQGEIRTFHAIPLTLWYAPLFVIPLTYTLAMLLPEAYMFIGIVGMVTIPVFAFSITPRIPIGLESVLAIGSILVSWWLFIRVSRMVCTKWSLVRS
jgi:hypothetical protein